MRRSFDITHGIAVQDTQTADQDPGVSSEIEVKKELEETCKRNMTCSDEAYSNALATGVNIIITRVYKFFKSEYEYLIKNYGEIFDVAPFSQYKERTSEATGFDVDVVSRALEELEIQDGGAKKRKLNVNDSQSCEDNERMPTKLTPVFIKMEKVDAYEDSQVTFALSDKSKDPLKRPTDSLENTAIQAPEAVMKNPLNIKVESDNPESDEHLSDRGIIIKEEIDIGKEELSNSMANSYVSLPWTTDDGSRNTAEENRSVRQSVPVAVDGNLCLSVRPFNIKNTQREYGRSAAVAGQSKTNSTRMDKFKRGKPFNAQARQMAFNVYLYFLNEANVFQRDHDGYFKKIQDRVTKATGISRRTLNNILNEKKQNQSMKFSTPNLKA